MSPGARDRLRRVPGLQRLWRAVYRRWRRLVAPTASDRFDDRPDRATRRDLRRLRARSRWSRASLVDAASGVVVTMTSHGERVRRVHLAIESIGRGALRPRRLRLFVEPETVLPARLRRLERRGLEVVRVPAGYRSHSKYWFHAAGEPRHAVPIATADDDILYPADWLSGLWAAHERHPDALVCWRAHRVRFEGDALAPYAWWPGSSQPEPSPANFGTGVSGQLLPAGFLGELRDAGDGFLATCPTADDVWLHRVAVANGRGVAQVGAAPVHFPFIPGSQGTGLYLENVRSERNDEQIAATYSPADLARIRANT